MSDRIVDLLAKRLAKRKAQVEKKGFEEIMQETDNFDGFEMDQIAYALRDDYDYSDEEVREFGKKFIALGLKEEWLLDELGF